MDKRIIYIIVAAFLLAAVIITLKFFFFGKEKIEVRYVIRNIKNNQVIKDSSVEFADQTKDAVKWKWNFGDGQYSFDKEPKHIYSSRGNYRVSLSVTTDKGSGIDSSKVLHVVLPIETSEPLPVSLKKDTTPVVEQAPKIAHPPVVKGKGTSKPKGNKSSPKHSFSTNGEGKIHDLGPENFNK